MSTRDPEPQPPETVNAYQVRYKGRDYYAKWDNDGGLLRADIAYLTDWKAWASRQLESAYAWQRSINEALNSGDGSYRP